MKNMERCVVCSRSIDQAKRRNSKALSFKRIKYQSQITFFNNQASTSNRRLALGDTLCHKCYMKHYNSTRRSNSQPSSESESAEESGSTCESESTEESESTGESESLDQISDVEDANEDEPERPGSEINQDTNSDSDNILYSDNDTNEGLLQQINELAVDDQQSEIGEDSGSSSSNGDSSDEEMVSDEYSDDSEEELDGQLVVTNPNSLRRSRSGHTSCVFGCSPVSEITVVPQEYRIFCICSASVYVPVGSRCCASHLETELENWLQIPHTNITVVLDEYIEAVTLLRMKLNSQRFGMIIKLPVESNNNFYVQWTGLTPSQFRDLMHIVQQPIVYGNVKYMVLTLMKMRVNLSFDQLASLIDCSSTTAKRKFKSNLVLIFNKFVPLHLGLHHANRDEHLSHRTYISKSLFNVPDDKLIVIADGTYIYHQKSMNAALQRRMYTEHKKRPLMKPFILCDPDGYIIDVISSFSPQDNDAVILKRVLTSTAGRQLFQPGDVFILDRGFRDCLSFLETEGFVAHSPRNPEPRERGQPLQLSTVNANYTRKVTKVRWVVEAINGHLKSIFRILHHIVPNSRLPSIAMIAKVCGAFYNAYYNRLESDQGYQEEIVTEMLRLEDRPNRLHELIRGNPINRQHIRFVDRPIEEVSAWFPTFDINGLYFFAQGSYQLKFVASYFADARLRIHEDGFHLQAWEDSSTLALDPWFAELEEPILIKARIPSHHSSTKVYFCYILVDDAKTGREKIHEYYCTCPSGRRTMGSCAHVVAIVWYASIGWRENPSIPAKHLNDFARRIRDIDQLDDEFAPDN